MAIAVAAAVGVAAVGGRQQVIQVIRRLEALRNAGTKANVLLVAGGGGGSHRHQGGAGAGGVTYYGANTIPKVPNGEQPTFKNDTSYTINIGGGGAGVTLRTSYQWAGSGDKGSNSTISASGFETLFSEGGGICGAPGGSGGGSPCCNIVGTGMGEGITGQGNRGGYNYTSTPGAPEYNHVGGGGGGAGAVGSNGVQRQGGAGGSGIMFGDFEAYGTDASNGTSGTTGRGHFASGGGGCSGNGSSNSPRTPGGGGYGGGQATAGQSGTSNTGGGAGCGGFSGGTSYAGGNGGSGIALIQYDGEPKFIGGTIDTATKPNTTIHAFTSLGALTPYPVAAANTILYYDAHFSTSYPGSGTSWFDLSGKNFTGTIVGSPTFTSAGPKFFTMNDSSSYISVADNATLRPSTGAISISTFLKIGNLSKRQMIAEKHSSPGAGWWFAIETTGKIVWLIVKSGGGEIILDSTNSTTLVAGSSYHLVATYSSGTMKLYVNGQDDTGAQTGSGSGITTSTNTLYIGSQVNWSPIYSSLSFYNISIYDRALTSQEVATTYTGMKGRYGL